MSIETVRVSEKGKQQLIQLKRKTGIENWNTLCRWALCLSLADRSVPPYESIPNDSNVEMAWKTFAGKHDVLYLTLLKQRLANDDLTNENLSDWCRIHMHRGISYLNSKVKSETDLVALLNQ